MRQSARAATLVVAAFVAIGSSPGVGAAVARRSPTTAHVNLQTKLGRYAVAITATTGRRAATLNVYLSRGNPARDQQTHSYTFALAPRAVFVDSRLAKARIRARLRSFGTVDLTLGGRGASSLQRASPCTGPATISRSARARGRITLRLGRLGTLRRTGRSILIDRLRRPGTVRCAPPKCRRYAGAQVAGINVAGGYLSLQSDGLGHTYVFGAVEQRLTKPSVSISHTRFALGGRLDASPGAGPDDRLIELTGGGPATGTLTFSGAGAPEPDAGCSGHTVRRIFGNVTGQMRLPIDGAGVIDIAADGSPAAPLGAYREQID